MFFYDYSKPGKGVNKRDPNQTPIFTFFDILHIKLVCQFDILIKNEEVV